MVNIHQSDKGVTRLDGGPPITPTAVDPGGIGTCTVEGCPGPDVDHTGEAAIGCGLERDSEECEA